MTMNDVDGQTRPHKTASEVLSEMDLAGRRMVLTGGTSGIGREAARALAARGATVLMTARNLRAGEEQAAALRAETGNTQVQIVEMDLMSLDSVLTAAGRIRERLPAIDVLILNAGVMTPVLARTDRLIESQFMTNYAGHLALSAELAPCLLAAAPSRIVSLTSSGHKQSPVVFEDINFQLRPYDGLKSYGQSKTAAALLAVELNQRLRDRGVLAFAVHPGVIMDTNLSRHVGGRRAEEDNVRRYGVPQWALKSVAEGAATTVWAAVSDDLADSGGGLYLEDCRIAQVSDDADPYRGVMPYAMDREAAHRLWEMTEQMLGRSFPV
jgi:NAD(P)-dependent dehydrogenase (short-subunit alcohol dehydrogenase family)